MAKDPRYKAVKSLIDAGGISTFRELFVYMPRKTLYTDLGMNYARFKRLEDSPEQFTVQELYQISLLFGVGHQKIIDLVLAQMEASKPKARKKG